MGLYQVREIESHVKSIAGQAVYMGYSEYFNAGYRACCDAVLTSFSHDGGVGYLTDKEVLRIILSLRSIAGHISNTEFAAGYGAALDAIGVFAGEQGRYERVDVIEPRRLQLATGN